MPPPDWVDVLSIGASAATILALPYAAYQVRRAKMSSSAAATAIVFSQINAKLDVLLSPGTAPHLYQQTTIELLNEIELCCAVYIDGQLAGYTGKFTRAFLKDVLAAIEQNKMLLDFAQKAIHTPHTFECIWIFCRRYKKDWQGLS